SSSPASPTTRATRSRCRTRRTSRTSASRASSISRESKGRTGRLPVVPSLFFRGTRPRGVSHVARGNDGGRELLWSIQGAAALLLRHGCTPVRCGQRPWFDRRGRAPGPAASPAGAAGGDRGPGLPAGVKAAARLFDALDALRRRRASILRIALGCLMWILLSIFQTMAAPGVYYEQAAWNGREFVPTGKALCQCETASWPRCALEF